MATVADVHEVEPEEYVGFRSLAAGREMAALLCRRYTNATRARPWHSFPNALVWGTPIARRTWCDEPRGESRNLLSFAAKLHSPNRN